VDFLTDLPPSQGNTTILVVVDRFSKSCHLLPLPGLPTALQTVEALFTYVFRHYMVPEDIVSDRGPQFTSRVWKAFMEHLGVSISLTSGFHPESNGQAERVNQDVGRFQRSYCQDRPGELARFVPWATMAQNPLLYGPVAVSVRVGQSAGPGTMASESDRGSCSGGLGTALKGDLESRPGIPKTCRWAIESER
jgi:hypothetical protein